MVWSRQLAADSFVGKDRFFDGGTDAVIGPHVEERSASPPLTAIG